MCGSDTYTANDLWVLHSRSSDNLCLKLVDVVTLKYFLYHEALCME